MTMIKLFIIGMITTQAQVIIPTPMQLESTNVSFQLSLQTSISIDDPLAYYAAMYFLQQLIRPLGYQLNLKNSAANEKNTIRFTSKGFDQVLGDEGYMLEVNEQAVTIRAAHPKGWFYGVQSLLQIMPVEVFSNQTIGGELVIPGCVIKDKPKYAWRSFMLDSGRQYQSPDFIKRYLDYMALLKMNVFHWHLTEGQGWRIEIKKYPKLTQVGAFVANGKEQQGYYTQDQIKEIVAYATQRHIEVVPEIDVPGHSEAALSAYPQYTCLKKAPESVMAFSAHLFCGGRESTYEFLQDVLDEVCELFPSEYIHLGGDEAPKKIWNTCDDCQKRIKDEGLADSHELQLYFSTRMAKYLKSKNRKTIFWGDVVYHEGMELPDNVVISWWNWRGHKDKALKNAIKRGHPVICNTNYYTYLNFPVSPWSNYAHNRTFDLKMTYENNPSDLQEPHDLVLGMSTCLWTDWHVQEHMIDRRVFPRIFTLSEQMWYGGKRLAFEDFLKKVQQKYLMLEQLKIDYGPAMKEDIDENYKWD
jgi:N-acetyl-beta-hexosaminidase